MPEKTANIDFFGGVPTIQECLIRALTPFMGSMREARQDRSGSPGSSTTISRLTSGNSAGGTPVVLPRAWRSLENHVGRSCKGAHELWKNVVNG